MESGGGFGQWSSLARSGFEDPMSPIEQGLQAAEEPGKAKRQVLSCTTCRKRKVKVSVGRAIHAPIVIVVKTSTTVVRLHEADDGDDDAV